MYFHSYLEDALSFNNLLHFNKPIKKTKCLIQYKIYKTQMPTVDLDNMNSLFLSKQHDSVFKENFFESKLTT